MRISKDLHSALIRSPHFRGWNARRLRTSTTKCTCASIPALSAVLTFSCRIEYLETTQTLFQMSCMKHTLEVLFTPSSGNLLLPRTNRPQRSGMDTARWIPHIPNCLPDGTLADALLQSCPPDRHLQKYPYCLIQFRPPPRVTTSRLFFSWCVLRIVIPSRWFDFVSRVEFHVPIAIANR